MNLSHIADHRSNNAPERFDELSSYENQLNRNPRWALAEGSRHFEEKSAVFDALQGITRRLNELGISYAVVGGLALFRHGFRRFTEDVDLLVDADSLERIHRELTGRGYLPPHGQSRNLRDTSNGVRIEFVVTGQYPGDGKPKPFAFPEPSAVSLEEEGIRYVTLPTLLELKLASGMTGRGRLKDLADAQELIKLLGLSRDYTSQLNPYVRDKFLELWDDAQA